MGCGREKDSHHHEDHKRGSNCVCDVVKSILEIQNQAVTDDCSTCTTNCFLEPLGGILSPARSNADTRVFTLLTKTGAPFLAHFSDTDVDDPCKCTSIYFRVEDVFNDCCATLRVLIPYDGERQDPNRQVVDLLNDEGTKFNFRAACEVVSFEASDSCITVDLDCFCAVQCIADVDLGICN